MPTLENPQAPSSSEEAERTLRRKARRRVALKIGFLWHALIFVLVNGFLWLMGRDLGVGGWAHGHWRFFPLGGWALGLTIHGLVVLLSLSGDGFKDRMLASEIERLRRKSTP